ncbi:hypothetical protein P4U44_13790 [Alkalihalobacillus alcalophilus]|nr:hypothetical protein [Alkalihalobacillus alcalophilus]
MEEKRKFGVLRTVKRKKEPSKEKFGVLRTVKQKKEPSKAEVRRI